MKRNWETGPHVVCIVNAKANCGSKAEAKSNDQKILYDESDSINSSYFKKFNLQQTQRIRQ